MTKKYGATTAVDHLTFTVEPGHITGFLGPNGAGKTTTMRLILGLDSPTAGAATVNGQSYRDKRAPIQEIGALLDPSAVHGGRSAYHHLLWQAQSGGLPGSRVDDVLEMVGLADVAGKKVGGFSLGMHQRLGIASALVVSLTCTLISYSFAWLFRGAASAITFSIGFFFLPYMLGGLLPAWVQENVLRYLPDIALDSLSGLTQAGSLTYLNQKPAALVVAAWLVGSLAVAATVLNRRDV